MNTVFNDRIKQVLLLIVIVLLALIIAWELRSFVPGLLGGLTLYFLTAGYYIRLTDKKSWKKGLTAWLFIIVCLILIITPVYLSVQLLNPYVQKLINDPENILKQFQLIAERIGESLGYSLLTQENLDAIGKKISSGIPDFLNSSVNLIANLLMMFFLYYFLLINGKEAGTFVKKLLPFHSENIEELASETGHIIRANALGIPFISLVQGIFATIGYLIFGIEDWGMWGFFTGVFAFFPLVGTMLIWVPLTMSHYLSGHEAMAIGLGLYSLIVTGNVDYLARMVFMKKMLNVHPIITVLGVIAGLSMFGFMGLIFGPLLISYLLILIRIYNREFSRRTYHNSENQPG
jgi:predicted PurR-regulated permease PerM